MKKTAFTLLGLLIAAVVILGIIAPKDFKVEREITINKPNDFVFNEIRFLKKHEQWNPWVKRDPNIVQTYEGTDGSEGAVVKWKGNKEVGVGEEEIKKITDGKRIDFELRFKEPFEGTNQSYLVTTPISENETKITWGMQGRSEFPVNIICFVLGMKDMLNKDFDQGLANLKANLESK